MTVSAANTTRREVFKLLGAGVVVFMGWVPDGVRAQGDLRVYPEDFNAYLAIANTGRVTVFSGKIEMGQGVLTSQAQMVAEELGVDLAAIDMVLGDTDMCPWDMGTFGSLTTRMFGPALRAAAAQARAELAALASQRFGVPVAQLKVHSGVVFVADDPSRALGFGELSKGARIAKVVDLKAMLRTASEFNEMGRSPKRLDGVEKVTGAARYAADIRRPGMLYARVLRPPVHGAIRTSLDTSQLGQVMGATLVDTDGLVAVLHATPDGADTAFKKITAQWQLPTGGPNPDTIFARLAASTEAVKSVVSRGDVDAAGSESDVKFASTFLKGYVAHAAIEPHAAIAEVKDGRMTVWASTQTPFPTRDRVAKAVGLDPRTVRVITPYLGGGFGGKSADAQAVEAARLAQATGKPVQVAWSRSEEFFNDTFDPAAVVKVTARADKNGMIVAWDYQVFAAGDRGAALVYAIPNVRIRSIGRAAYEQAGSPSPVHPFAVGAWRAPGANMNVFAVESQMDIVARGLGVDPLAFRLQNLADARMRRVLQAAADAFGYRASIAPGRSGTGVGLACSADAGTCVATVAELQVNPTTGAIQVLRMVCAQDMGVVVNPEGARMQMEGGLTMGLGYTLAEELRFAGGDILDRNFDSYHIPRFSWVPHIETILIKNDALAPQGGGEPAITTTGAAIANAVFDATGARMVRLPLTPLRVLQAIAQS